MADRTSRLRGVNLGGWLVLEKWITPSLFEGSGARDEFSLMQTAGSAEKIEWHRQTFIIEQDIAWLAANGINALRVPIGYWVFDGDGPFTACISYLDWLFKMASKYDLKILIDLHAAKGSQNGKNHSGRIGQSDWYASRSYQQETIDILRRLADRYSSEPALWGIELLNEPKLNPLAFFRLKKFYNKAYQELAPLVSPETYIVFSDGFVPWLFSGKLKATKGRPVALDVHWYQFGHVNYDKYFSTLAKRARLINKLQRQQPVIIGEWSGMLSHKTLAGMAKSEKAALQRRHVDLQLRAYSEATGWFYWTYKTEKSNVWNFRWMVESGSLLLE